MIEHTHKISHTKAEKQCKDLDKLMESGQQIIDQCQPRTVIHDKNSVSFLWEEEFQKDMPMNRVNQI